MPEDMDRCAMCGNHVFVVAVDDETGIEIYSHFEDVNCDDPVPRWGP
jgi:hypothetical protein